MHASFKPLHLLLTCLPNLPVQTMPLYMLYAAYLDLKATFDLVDRGVLWLLLKV